MAKVTMNDIRTAQICSRGARWWFGKYNLNWSDFLKNGLDESFFLETKDAMALRAVEAARKREDSNNG